MTANKEELSFKVAGGLFGGKFLAEFSAETTIDGLKKGEFKVKGSLKIDTSFFENLFQKLNEQIGKLIYKMISKIQNLQQYQALLSRTYLKKILDKEAGFFQRIGDICEFYWNFVCSTISATLDLQDTMIAGMLDVISVIGEGDPVQVKKIGFDTVLDDNAAAKAASDVLQLSFDAKISNKDVTFDGAPTLSDNGESISKIIFDKTVELMKLDAKKSMYFKSVKSSYGFQINKKTKKIRN